MRWRGSTLEASTPLRAMTSPPSSVTEAALPFSTAMLFTPALTRISPP